MKLLFSCLLLLLLLPATGQTDLSRRPKIGLTLSGGAAKGLAHIGILKAIDSAGLKVDFITGTSMGSIIGALYAAGYSGIEIEQLARKVDWDILLSNQSTLRSLLMAEKEEYSRYAVELPWVNTGFKLPTGVLQAEELWLKLSELFFPVYNIKNFDHFSIPFKCIGTDIATGEAVVMDKGEVVTAIRSSMAIPSLFTAVEYDGRRLVDGGIVRNFPVTDVKAMGADIVIGSQVATGLLPKEKLVNAFQILLQIAFLKEAEENKKGVELCDIYISMPMENYNAGSFNKSKEILEFGLKEGRNIYPRLKILADSLDQIYGPMPKVQDRLPVVDSIRISSFEINGLKNTTPDFFTHMMGFETNRFYTAGRLTNMVRKVFGTRYYNRIVYALQPDEDGSSRIVFDVTENPLSFAKLGIHYNTFTGIGILINLTSRNFLLPHSRSMVTLNIGDNFRARGEHLQYLGRGKNIAMILGSQYDRLDFTTYNKFKKDGLYSMQLFKAAASLQYSGNRKFTVGLGTRYEWIKYKPSIQSVLDISGKNEFVTSYVYAAVNTLDKSIYPKRGWKVDAELGRVYNQSPSVTYYSNGEPISNLDSLGISYNNFPQVIINSEMYLPLHSRTTLFTMIQSGINFDYRQNILNDFIVGGMSRQFKNQILFAGLEEGSVTTPSVASLQLGVRYEIFNNGYILLRTNALVNNFISTNNIVQKPNFISGHSMSFGYNFALGPLEVSAMYCDQSKKLHSYINLGISF
ncbi:MAG: patatin-like phospholipase family protein [Chitinophagaceae bacterium]|nr:patatin-like phospholipase family protein [Chitinophagaceae bacterium]